MTHREPGVGCTTTSQPIYCQGGRKSVSLVQLSPDAPTFQIGWQLLPCNPPYWDSDSVHFKCHSRLVGTQQVQPWRRVGLGRCRATQPRPLLSLPLFHWYPPFVDFTSTRLTVSTVTTSISSQSRHKTKSILTHPRYFGRSLIIITKASMSFTTSGWNENKCARLY